MARRRGRKRKRRRERNKETPPAPVCVSVCFSGDVMLVIDCCGVVMLIGVIRVIMLLFCCVV